MINSLKNICSRLVVLIAIFVLSCSGIFAQFEQKLTINASAVFLVPDITASEAVYSSGIGGDGGLQYNFSKYFSFIANGRFNYIFGNAEHPDAFKENLAIGAGIKVNFAPRAVVNPYVFGELNVNFIWFEDYIYYDEPIYNGVEFEFGTYIEDSGFGIGGFGGGGVDFRISENISLYIQVGAYYTHYDSNVHIYSQAGLRLNLLKSKTI